MTIQERRDAIGGPEAGDKYLRIIAAQLTAVMADDGLRQILHRVVPEMEQGAIHVCEISDKFPQFLEKLSDVFKSSVDDEAISGDLARIVGSASSAAEATYKVSKALFDLELSVAVPPSQKWDGSIIPVFFAPASTEVSTIEGVGTDLKPISMPVKEGPLSICLFLNYDEDVLSESRGGVTLLYPQHENMWAWQNILNFFSVSSAYAHYPPSISEPNDSPHHPCYAEKILQPVYKIVIFSKHEYWWQRDPEIEMGIIWRKVGVEVLPYFTELPNVNKPHKHYTEYGNKRTLHGTCGTSGVLQSIYVQEDDPWGKTTLGRWTNQTIPATNEKTFFSPHTRLWVRRTNENASG